MIPPGTAIGVLGWYGSAPRHVERIAALWAPLTRGPVVTSPCSGFFPRVLADAIEFEAKLNATRASSVVFHAFSNRGTLVYLLLLWRRRLTARVVGVVFDSAPGEPTWLSLVRAVSANSKSNALRLALFFLVPGLLLGWSLRRRGMARTLMRLVWSKLGEEILSRAYLSRVAKWDPARAPALFMYSEEDALVLAPCVRRVAEARARNMGNVTLQQHSGSAHVRHFVDFPREYVASLEQFAASLQL
jgi:pimeloyl-ACP methyl ester carboxylesterase